MIVLLPRPRGVDAMRSGLLLLSGARPCGGSGQPRQPQRAVMTAAEKAWVEGALPQLRTTLWSRRLQFWPHERHPTMILFNERCRFEAGPSDKPTWIGEAHSGKIRLLKNSIDARVVAMEDTNPTTGAEYFVMSLPSIWKRPS